MKNEHFDLNIERALLSAALNSSDAFWDLRELLSPADFYQASHQDLFEGMIACAQNKQPVSESFIKKYKDIDENTLNLVISTSGIIDYMAYAKELRQMAIKRGLLNLAGSMPARVRADVPAKLIVDKLGKDIYELSKDASEAVVKDAPTVVEELLLEYQQQKEREDKSILGLDTGFDKLNEMSKGFKEGELLILAARPGMGKTTLCLNFIYKILKEDKGVVLFSLEMPATQILQRLVAQHTGIDLQRIMTAQLSDDEWSSVSDACEYFSHKKLFIHDSGYASILDIRAILRRLKQEEESIALCAVDYIQLMTSSSNFSERHLQVSEISRGLKLLARELKLPIIALSQLNRMLESRPNKRPMLSDLRESGAIEQDADTILFVYREAIYKEALEREKEEKAKAEGKHYERVFTANNEQEPAELIVGKNRHGPTGAIHVLFQKNHSCFIEDKKGPDTFAFEE